GHKVIADSVNPWMLTRDAWRDAGLRAGARVVEVETLCSDLEEHRRRIATRKSEVVGLAPPNWESVIGRDYHAWNREHLKIDTARFSIAESVAAIRATL